MKLLLALFLLVALQLQAATVICFHGNGAGNQWTNPQADGGKFVADMKKQGFMVLVAKSFEDKWSPVNSPSNPDIKSVLAQLKAGGFAAPYYLLGHSNGGGMVSRFTVFSGLKITAVQYSNASGILQILKSNAYTVPSLFAYSPKDPIVPVADVKEAVTVLTNRKVPVFSLNLKPYYDTGAYRNQHAFVNTAAVTGPWFKQMTK